MSNAPEELIFNYFIFSHMKILATILDSTNYRADDIRIAFRICIPSV